MASSAGPARAESSLGRKDRPSNPLALVFERDKHAGTIRLHLAVLDRHVGPHNLGNSDVPVCVAPRWKTVGMFCGQSFGPATELPLDCSGRIPLLRGLRAFPGFHNLAEWGAVQSGP